MDRMGMGAISRLYTRVLKDGWEVAIKNDVLCLIYTWTNGKKKYYWYVKEEEAFISD